MGRVVVFSVAGVQACGLVLEGFQRIELQDGIARLVHEVLARVNEEGIFSDNVLVADPDGQLQFMLSLLQVPYRFGIEHLTPGSFEPAAEDVLIAFDFSGQNADAYVRMRKEQSEQ